MLVYIPVIYHHPPDWFVHCQEFRRITMANLILDSLDQARKMSRLYGLILEGETKKTKLDTVKVYITGTPGAF